MTDASFPSDVAGVLGVGAVDRDDDRWYYTPSAGNDIDVVAPSGNTRQRGDVRTTDRMGSLGYERSSGDDYTPRFGGTSAAAPQASGVAALMLSLNPSLTESEVRSIIESTADDYGNTDWDGDGRLNAHQAVLDGAPPIDIQITGPTGIDEGETGTWEAHASGGTGTYAYSWQKRSDVDEPWYGTCASASSCSTAFYDNDSGDDLAAIRVFVDSGGRTASRKKDLIVYEGSGDGGGCNAPATEPNKPCLDGAITSNIAGAAPEAFALQGNSPNPFRGSTKIKFAMPEAAHVELVVYDVMGREVARPLDERVPAGYHYASFDAGGLPSGVYVYHLRAGEAFAESGKMVVVK